MTRDEEIAIVQNFANMAGIERFAKALFEEQGKIVSGPVLQLQAHPSMPVCLLHILFRSDPRA